MSYSRFYLILEEKISGLFKAGENLPAELYEPQQYILSLGGKRLRPLLALIGADLFDGDIHKAIPSSLAVELFHNFSLIHDDILDKAPLRRGKKTVHTKWNTNVAILSGDALFVRAYAELAESPKEYLPELLRLFNKTGIEVCEGQQEDMNFENRSHVSVEEYTEMITKKTAVLLACSLMMGAICAGAQKSEAEKLYACGKHLGIAFQLKDDLLDVYSDDKVFGKQPGGDIISNKKTFLLLKSIEMADAGQLKDLEYWLLKKDFVAEEKVAGVKQVFDKLSIRETAEREMHLHFETAMQLLDEINCGGEKRNTFKKFCAELMNREK